jgi:hypothetical protein
VPAYESAIAEEMLANWLIDAASYSNTRADITIANVIHNVK